MPKLIDALPAPLLDDLVGGSWLPIVGAGFSRNAEYEDGLAPADWSELGRELGRAVAGAPTDAPPIESISAFEQSFGRVALVDRVGRLIRAHEAQPGRAHLAFAKVGFTNVLTTNFDFLLERAYDRIRKGCLPVLDEAQLSAPNRSAGPRIIKFHGDLHHPTRLVLTEEDYDQFLHLHPLLATSVSAMLVDHTGVLIGYSLDDPDTRHLLALLKLRLGNLRRPLWTIQFDAKPHTIARFERRGVKVVNLRLKRGQSIASGFAQLFDELANYWTERVPDFSISSDDRVTADLQLPKQDGRRLCYFAIPTRLIGWYRDNVFPEVEAFGLVPVIAREVFSAPGTALTKIDALIDRALLVIAEVGSDATSYEAALALARKGPTNVLLVRSEQDSITAPGLDTLVASRPWATFASEMRPALDADPERFALNIRQWLSDVAQGGIKYRDEPSRLLAAQEYGPALISAVSLLEVALSQALDRKRDEMTRTSLRILVKEARRANLIQSDDELQDIEHVIAKRNEAVHRVSTVTASEARRGVDVVLRVVERATQW